MQFFSCFLLSAFFTCWDFFGFFFYIYCSHVAHFMLYLMIYSNCVFACVHVFFGLLHIVTYALQQAFQHILDLIYE